MLLLWVLFEAIDVNLAKWWTIFNRDFLCTKLSLIFYFNRLDLLTGTSSVAARTASVRTKLAEGDKYALHSGNFKHKYIVYLCRYKKFRLSWNIKKMHNLKFDKLKIITKYLLYSFLIKLQGAIITSKLHRWGNHVLQHTISRKGRIYTSLESWIVTGSKSRAIRSFVMSWVKRKRNYESFST